MAAGLGFKDFTTGEVLTAADVDGYLMQGIWVFASAAARDAAVTAPAEGNFAFTKDTNSLWYYDGAAWVASGAAGDIEGVTAGVGISGGGTSGTVTITNSMATAIDAKGDLVAGTGADTFSKLTVGANDTILTADSTTATGLKWASPASSGGLTLIQETVASAATSITFSSIPQTYKQLILVWGAMNHSGSTGNFSLRFNNNANSYYAMKAIETSGSSVNQQNELQTSFRTTNTVSFGNNVQGDGVYETAVNGYVIIDNYTSTSKYKQIWGYYAYTDATSAKRGSNALCSFLDTTAITSLDIVRLSGSATISNFTNTSIRLYGLS